MPWRVRVGRFAPKTSATPRASVATRCTVLTSAHERYRMSTSIRDLKVVPFAALRARSNHELWIVRNASASAYAITKAILLADYF